jgi:hypothetical protein
MAQQWPLSAMKPIGRVQRGVQRAFLVFPKRAFTTRELLAWTHPRGMATSLRERRNYCRAIRRAADRVAMRVGRRWPDGLIWRLVQHGRDMKDNYQ